MHVFSSHSLMALKIAPLLKTLSAWKKSQSQKGCSCNFKLIIKHVKKSLLYTAGKDSFCWNLICSCSSTCKWALCRWSVTLLKTVILGSKKITGSGQRRFPFKWNAALCFPYPNGSKNGTVLYHLTESLQRTYFILKSLAEGDNLKEAFFRR